MHEHAGTLLMSRIPNTCWPNLRYWMVAGLCLILAQEPRAQNERLPKQEKQALKAHVRQYIHLHFPTWPIEAFQLIAERHSRTGAHYHFEIHAAGRRIRGAFLKIDGSVGHWKAHYQLPPNPESFQLGHHPPPPAIQIQALELELRKQSSYPLHKKLEAIWYQDSSTRQWIAAWHLLLSSTDSRIGEQRFILHEQGTILEQENLLQHKTHSTPGDSLVHALVFQPDPLTVAQVPYGGPWADRQDSTDTLFRQVMDTVLLKAQFKADTFRLRDSAFVFGDFDPPANPLCFGLTDTLFFERDTSCFEWVQAYYHLGAFRDYLHSLGDTLAGQDSIRVDIAGQSGADGSSYSDFNRLLSLGTGGVDDAEDPDVIIHEYGHSLHGDMCPNTNQGIQRRALEEGNCDYFAAIWSSRFSTYKDYNVFDWDGHNEFWDGRIINTNDRFPEDYIGNIYQDGQIWSTALYEAGKQISQDTMMIILLESMYQFFPNMTLRESAQLILHTDSLLFDEAHEYPLRTAFFKRGLITQDPDAVHLLNQGAISIRNTAGFQKGEAVYIQAHAPILRIRLYDMSGRRMNHVLHTVQATKAEVQAPQLPPGLYLLEVVTQKGRISQKLLR